MSQFDLPPGLWAANVDKAQIGQVVQNLVINATQAMPSGGTLRIAASNEHVAPGSHAMLAEGEYVRISVADTGEGIAHESLGKIFDPYFTTKRLGHGLGLATVFSIIKRHKGHIEVDSALGKGTTFTFWLPAAPSARPDPERTKAFEASGAGGRVLFMDDEEPILRMARRLMNRMGYDFEPAADGREAIDRYRAAKEAGRPFDLVVMDLTIPGGMGGKEAISILRQYDPCVRAIVSSGYSSDLAMADFREHGFRGMVAKPYDINELASVIRAVIREPAEPVPHVAGG
jgi:CheY-like chemotaxis protein